MGFSAVELAIMLEELGRVADPTPFLATTSQYVPPSATAVDADQRRALLDAVCAGGTGAVAFEPDGVRAEPDGDGWRPHGHRASRDRRRPGRRGRRSWPNQPDTDRLGCRGVRRAGRRPGGDPVADVRRHAPPRRRRPRRRARRGRARHGRIDGGGRARAGPTGGRSPAWPRRWSAPRSGSSTSSSEHVRVPPAVRRADRLVPGGQAHGRRRLRRHRAGPGAVPLRRADHRRGRRPPGRGRVDGQGGGRRLPAHRRASTASSSSAASASPGRTTCSSSSAGRRPASCCSARPPSTGPGWPAAVGRPCIADATTGSNEGATR